MNTYRSLVLGFGFASLASLAGCSSSSESPFGSDPDFAAIESRFRSPTGSFDQSKAGTTISAYNEQKKTADNKSMVAGSVSGTATNVSTKAQSLALRSMGRLALLDSDEWSSTYSESSSSRSESQTSLMGDDVCADLKANKYSGNCACPRGGSYDYDFESARALESYKGGDLDLVLRTKFNGCTQDDTTITGPLFFSLHANGSTIRSGSKLSDMRMLMDANLHAKQGTREQNIEFSMLIEEGKTWMSVTTDDGNIVISASPDWGGSSGTMTIRDREHTYTCSFKNGDGACTLENGKKVDVRTTASASSNEDNASDGVDSADSNDSDSDSDNSSSDQ